MSENANRRATGEIDRARILSAITHAEKQARRERGWAATSDFRYEMHMKRAESLEEYAGILRLAARLLDRHTRARAFAHAERIVSGEFEEGFMAGLTAMCEILEEA